MYLYLPHTYPDRWCFCCPYFLDSLQFCFDFHLYQGFEWIKWREDRSRRHSPSLKDSQNFNLRMLKRWRAVLISRESSSIGRKEAKVLTGRNRSVRSAIKGNRRRGEPRKVSFLQTQTGGREPEGPGSTPPHTPPRPRCLGPCRWPWTKHSAGEADEVTSKLACSPRGGRGRCGWSHTCLLPAAGPRRRKGTRGRAGADPGPEQRGWRGRGRGLHPLRAKVSAGSTLTSLPFPFLSFLFFSFVFLFWVERRKVGAGICYTPGFKTKIIIIISYDINCILLISKNTYY